MIYTVSTMWAKQKGFTIVELLIVIVVIAILAAITIVAYNGIQERAESLRVISKAQSYVKGLKLWEAETGARPTTSSCIAPASNTTCSIFGWGSGQPNDATFNSTLAQYAGTGVPELFKYGNDTPKGLMFYHSNWYGQSRGVLGYRIGPNTDCGLSPLIDSNHTSYAPSGQNYTSRSSTHTVCEVEVFKY